MSAKSKTAKKIVLCAQAMFLKNNYSNVLVDDIARESGVSKKTIYNHFRSKLDILLASIEQFAVDYRTQAEAILNDIDLSLRQKVTHYLHFMCMSFSNTSPDFWTNLRTTEPEAWIKLCNYRRDILLEHFSRLMDEGVKAGYIREDANRNLALLIYITAMQQLTDHDYIKQFPEAITGSLPGDIARQADQVVQLLLKGLLVKEL